MNKHVSIGIGCIICLMMLINACSSNDKKATAEVQMGGNAKIEFAETSFDFNEIKQGEIVSHSFKFKNVGDANLIITKTKSSCGCTVPKYDSQPIPPGAEGFIEVRFDSKGNRGYRHKTVTIYTNTKPDNVVLHISANVTEDNNNGA